MKLETSITTRRTVDEIVTTYKAASVKITEGYRLLHEAEVELHQCLSGAPIGQYNITDYETIDHNARLAGDAASTHIIATLKKKIWRRLIDMIGIRKFLSVKRADEIDRALYDNAAKDIFPAIETAVILST